MFGKKKSTAGLDIGSSSIKMVELEGKLNNLNLVSLGFENLPGDTIIDGQIMELNVVSDVIQSGLQWSRTIFPESGAYPSSMPIMVAG